MCGIISYAQIEISSPLPQIERREGGKIVKKLRYLALNCFKQSGKQCLAGRNIFVKHRCHAVYLMTKQLYQKDGWIFTGISC